MVFRTVRLEDRRQVEQYVRRFGENSCQYSFPSMYCLSNKYGDQICEQDGWLFVLRSRLCTEVYRTYLFPLGDSDPSAAVKRIMEDAEEHHARIRFETVTERQKNILDAFFPGKFLISEDRDKAEYIYNRDRIADLAGYRLCGRRKEVETFWELYGDSTVISPIGSEDISDIRKFQKDWVSKRRSTASWEYLCHENEAVDMSLSHFPELGFEGIVIRIDNEIRGYSFGYRMSSECMDGMHEKCDTGYSGIYSVLKQEVARAAEGIKLLNWEEDLGVAGLRTAKLSYKPDILMAKFLAEELQNEPN